MSTTQYKELTRPIRALALVVSATIAMGITACQSGHRNVVDGGRREAKGDVEATVGGAIGDDGMKGDGQRDQDKGKTQKAVGKVQEKVDVTVRQP
jgi:uncharacterized protein YjbJ (UPF0337 family)